MGPHDMIAFHEGLHRQLPVGRYHRRDPPFDLELVDIARVEGFYSRLDGVEQRCGIVVEIDESAAAPQLNPARHQIELGLLQILFAENLPAEHESVLTLHVEAPAVEGADEALSFAIAMPAGELDAAMAAGIVERLDP